VGNADKEAGEVGAEKKLNRGTESYWGRNILCKGVGKTKDQGPKGVWFHGSSGGEKKRKKVNRKEKRGLKRPGTKKRWELASEKKREGGGGWIGRGT